MIEPIFKLGYEVIVTAHVAHLQTKSYSRHKALNKVYDELPDMLDSLLESWQGKYGTVIKDIGSLTVGDDSTFEAKLDTFDRYISAQVPTMPLDIQDELLSIQNFINSIKYKLILK
jgi:hypothetical protein